MQELAYLNGTFLPIDEAMVPINDRGFVFGDSIYEVLFSYGGGLFLLDAHIQRLRRSTAAVRMNYDFETGPLEPIMFEGLQRSGLRDAMIYTQITRGVAPRDHAVPATLNPTLVMTFRPRPVISQAQFADGVGVITARDTRWQNCYIKANTLLPNILAKTEAARQDCFEALFVTDTGEVREATSANLFVVKDGEVFIPPRNNAILHGITQAFIADCAKTLEIPLWQRVTTLDALRDADEVFLSSTTVEVLPVTRIDSRPVANGRPGPITRQLHERFLADLPTHCITKEQFAGPLGEVA